MTKPALRLGLCCIFREQPIKFSTTTAASVGKLSRAEQLAKLARIAAGNAAALQQAIDFCLENGIGCFRVSSQILPLKTHPTCGYAIDELPGHEKIVAAFRACGAVAEKNDLRLCFHPDQFVVLNSQRPEVVASSLAEIEYQAEVAEWIGADVINIHGGGAYGNKLQALEDFGRNLSRLSDAARERLTVENDDHVFTPSDLLPLSRAEGIPLVYDVHHHRCLPDGLTIEAATESALGTWKREPLFHISSPLEGWQGPRPERHHDYIDLGDWPECWNGRQLTVEIEAKAKELAVLQLRKQLAEEQGRGVTSAARRRRGRAARDL